MSFDCRSSDARSPVRATYVNLYRWPESDAEFARSVAAGGGNNRTGSSSRRRRWGPGGGAGVVVDGYSCRQMYLKSYTFTTKKESVPQRTRNYFLGKLKDRAALFPFLRRHGGDPLPPPHHHQKSEKNKNLGSRRKKTGCVVVARKLREVSRSVISSISHRLLSCTTSTDVVDRRRPPPY